jgi:polyphosphate kinase 2 (PPK2 family)
MEGRDAAGKGGSIRRFLERETTATFNEIPQTRTEHETNVSQQISITNQNH